VKSETIEIVALEGGTFSAQLVPQISTALAKHNLTKRDIDAFAVASGPGSFTGLRVGLAAIKALAEVLQKPIAAVSLLEALARAAPDAPGMTLAAMDAGRGELYVGTFEIQNEAVSCVKEDLKTVEEFSREVQGKRAVTTDQKLADLLRGNSVTVIASPHADFVARVGYEKLRAGHSITPEALDATYIRRSDAEVKFSR
jgi:tRNA threonylcarbamoyladenosine biosynthesis protein TsaB